MTADIRTAAQREALAHRVHQDIEPGEYWGIVEGFADGAVWGATRVTPTREQIADVLDRHNFDELLLGSIEWDGYTAACACGWRSVEYKMPVDAHQAHSEHAAANVLALMAGLAEGEG